jgi:hypothetical protein
MLLMNSSSIHAAHYTVKPGEILSRIARRHFGPPTYSEKGALAKILSLNPKIKNPNHIHVGQRIRIDESSTAKVVTALESRSHPQISDPVMNQSLAKPQLSFSNLSAAPEFRFLRIDSQDKQTKDTAVLLSSSYVIFPLSWVQRWNAQFSTYQRFQYSFLSLEHPAEKTLSNTSLNPLGFGMGLTYELGTHNRYQIEWAVDQVPFLKATSASSVKLDLVAIPNMKFSYERDLFRLKPFSTGFKLKGEQYAPAKTESFNTEIGLGYGGGVYLQQDFQRSFLRCDMGILKTNQNTSITSQSRTDLSFQVNYSFRLGH